MTLVIAPGKTENKGTPIQGDTLLAYLIDRSGSMGSCWEDTIGGLNADIETQRSNDDENTEVAIYFFDGHNGNTSLVCVYQGPLKDAPTFDPNDSDYRPRGTTPLHDSVGQMIQQIEDRVDASENNPIILVSIFTDGGNNHSNGFSAETVKQMVESCQGRGWTFTYFGANQDAWAVSSVIGVAAGNTMAYSTSNMAETMAASSVARSAFVSRAKGLKHHDANAVYSTDSFFQDAGQSEDDYK